MVHPPVVDTCYCSATFTGAARVQASARRVLGMTFSSPSTANRFKSDSAETAGIEYPCGKHGYSGEALRTLPSLGSQTISRSRREEEGCGFPPCPWPHSTQNRTNLTPRSTLGAAASGSITAAEMVEPRARISPRAPPPLVHRLGKARPRRDAEGRSACARVRVCVCASVRVLAVLTDQIRSI